MNAITVLDLGLQDYGEVWRLQQELVEKRAEGKIGDRLLLVEHPPVYTVGRRSHDLSFEGLGLPVYRIERGGDITYHGPGQLVGYPILKIESWPADVKLYVETLEGILLDAVGRFGIRGRRVEGHTGLWVGEKKLASIGVAVRRWVTYHGFALNVNCDLEPFRRIRPCGLDGERITSARELLGHEIPMADVKAAVLQAFSDRMGARLNVETLAAVRVP